jgi:hypothetical protein
MKGSAIFFFLIIFLPFLCSAQIAIRVSKKELKGMVGCWEGSLTYLDYSTGRPYTMPAGMEVKKMNSGPGFISRLFYPDEPKANTTDTFSVSKKRDMLEGGRLVARQKNDSGQLVLVTERNGLDGNDNKPAVIRYTYILGSQKFIRKKEVQFLGSTEWIKRHEYNFTAIICSLRP